MVFLLALLAAMPPAAAAAGGDDEWANPVLGDPQAIEDGGKLFRARCTGCHWNPLRGPRIFQTKRTYEKFLEIVINGKKTVRTMPPFGYLLTPDDISKIHAYLMSRERP
ncbi:MAG TPA: cytochrome c [Alphaproteobacteria bacterium]